MRILIGRDRIFFEKYVVFLIIRILWDLLQLLSFNLLSVRVCNFILIIANSVVDDRIQLNVGSLCIDRPTIQGLVERGRLLFFSQLEIVFLVAEGVSKADFFVIIERFFCSKR